MFLIYAYYIVVLLEQNIFDFFDFCNCLWLALFGHFSNSFIKKYLPVLKCIAGNNTREITEMTLFLVIYTEISNIS